MMVSFLDTIRACINCSSHTYLRVRTNVIDTCCGWTPNFLEIVWKAMKHVRQESRQVALFGFQTVSPKME